MLPASGGRDWSASAHEPPRILHARMRGGFLPRHLHSARPSASISAARRSAASPCSSVRRARPTADAQHTRV